MVIVVFRSRLRTDADVDAYESTNARLNELATHQPGFISIESFSTPDGEKVSIVRFDSEESVTAWRNHPEHRDAQRRARAEFYESYSIQTAHTVREYEFQREHT